MSDAAWDGRSGTAGGAVFGAALAALARERELDIAAFAAATGDDPAHIRDVVRGSARVSSAELARYALALRLRPLEFLQKSALLSLDVYALGLDPLYFLPEGSVRYDARIYMREINPRHAVPERDMFVRNPALRAVAEDTLLDEAGKLELQLTYLLRCAAQATGGSL